MLMIEIFQSFTIADIKYVLTVCYFERIDFIFVKQIHH